MKTSLADLVSNVSVLKIGFNAGLVVESSKLPKAVASYSIP